MSTVAASTSSNIWPEVPALSFTRSWAVPAKMASRPSLRAHEARAAKSAGPEPGLGLFQGGVIDVIKAADGLGRAVAGSFTASRHSR